MTIDRFVVTEMDNEDQLEMLRFATFIRDGRVSDPNLGLAMTPEGWEEALKAWRTLVYFIRGLEKGPMLSFDQYVMSTEAIEPRPKLPRGQARGRTRDTTRRGH